MASNGICDRVAIVGMGCTAFGEHWDRSVGDMLIESSGEALESAGVKMDDIDAFWLGTMGNMSGLTLSEPLKIQYKPVSRVENFCATGSEAIRNAAYAVASGAYDCVMAIGVEKTEGLRIFRPDDRIASWGRVEVDNDGSSAFFHAGPGLFQEVRSGRRDGEGSDLKDRTEKSL